MGAAQLNRNMSFDSERVVRLLSAASATTMELSEVMHELPEYIYKIVTRLREKGWVRHVTQASGYKAELMLTQEGLMRVNERPLSPLPIYAKARVDPAAGPVAGPRCISVMHGTYKPPPEPVGRPGAMDFRAVPSRGIG